MKRKYMSRPYRRPCSIDGIPLRVIAREMVAELLGRPAGLPPIPPMNPGDVITLEEGAYTLTEPGAP